MNVPEESILALAARIVSAHVTHNEVPPESLPRLVSEVARSLRTAQQAATVPERRTPAVPIQHSVARDAVACLECGRRFRTLKRHLEREHNLSEAAYRAQWDLPASYPLTAPEYTELRAEVARRSGLGRKPRGRRRR